MPCAVDLGEHKLFIFFKRHQTNNWLMVEKQNCNYGPILTLKKMYNDETILTQFYHTKIHRSNHKRRDDEHLIRKLQIISNFLSNMY